MQISIALALGSQMGEPIGLFLNSYSFHAPLKSSLVLSAGTGSATFTRATAATVWGYAAAANEVDGQTLLTVASGEARFTGARRVSEGVWSETFADGSAIPDATLKGYLAEGARTNRCLYSQDFSNAAWVESNVTKASNEAVAPDGTTTADTLTATAANGTVIQDFGVVASAAKSGCLWIKRKTGTGNIDLTLDNGSTWTTKAVTSTWTRFEVNQTLADEDFGIRIVTSGDAVWVWQGQVETAAFSSSDIPTTTAAVTRAADVLSYPGAGNVSNVASTLYSEFSVNQYPPSESYIGGIVWVGEASSPRFFLTVTGSFPRPVTTQVYDGTNAMGSSLPSFVDLVVGATNKIAAAFSIPNQQAGLAMNEELGTASTPLALTLGALNTIYVGYKLDQAAPLFGNIRNVKIWQKAAENAALIRATT